MNILLINKGISPWGISASYVREALKSMSGDIEVHISSYGGSVFEGIEIYNILRNYSANKGKVTTVNISKCMSIASLIFLAGDERKAYSNATFMGHKAWTVVYGNSNDMQREFTILDGMDDIIAGTYKKFQSHKSIADIKTEMLNEMWYIGEKQLLESGFVDEIITDAKDSNTIPSQDDAESNYLDFKNQYTQQYVSANIRVDYDKAEQSIQACKGNCTLVENPDSGNSASKNNNNKGATVTIQEQLDKANSTISTYEAEIQTSKETIKALTEDKDRFAKGVIDAKDTYDSQAKNHKEVMKEIVASMFNEDGSIGVSKEVAANMAKCDNIEASNKILITHLKSNGASANGEPPVQNNDAAPDEEMEAQASKILAQMEA